MSINPKPRPLISALKRKTRFSLRSLLLATTLISLWLGLFFNRVQNERRAASAIAAASGHVIYNWQIRPLGSDPYAKLKQPGPEWLRRYLGPHWLDEIVKVNLNEFTNPSEKNNFALVGPYLAKLPALRSLSLWGGKIDLKDCELIGKLTQIEKLFLRPESVIEPQHTNAIAGARNLKKFTLQSAKISAAAISQLSKIPNLSEIDISCDSFDRQTGMPLKKYYLSDKEAHSLASFRNLRSLMLFHTQITDEGLEALCSLSQLETLVVSSPNITSKSFDHVEKLIQLEHLGTWGWKINDDDFRQLYQMPNLVSLDFHTSLTDESVLNLMPFQGLKRLTLRGDEITEASVRPLCKFQELTRLNLSDTSIPKNSDAATLLIQSLPNCLIRLPKTEREKEAKRRFINSKSSGLGTKISSD